MTNPTLTVDVNETLFASTPLVRLSYLCSLLGMTVPLVLTIAVLVGQQLDRGVAAALLILWGLMLFLFVWSARAYREVYMYREGLRVVAGLSPFRRVHSIPFASITAVHITDYSHKIVLEVDEETKVVAANFYTTSRAPLPSVALEAHEPHGTYEVLKALKALIIAKIDAQDATSGRNSDEATP